jgi:POT family proton-dependent oligopeptide transporter
MSKDGIIGDSDRIFDESNAPKPVAPPEWFGHPKGLFYLFFAELWERFSFYGMRALLTLYMANKLFVDLEDGTDISYGIYAAYGALVYSTPFLGGILADRILGYRKAILLGGVLMSIGHFVLAIENDFFFYGGLGLIVVGNGFFKPNISTFVGTLYRENDPRRDAGFNIFYMGINVGAWIAPLICGWLAVEYGWHYGFGAAGIGMVIGLIVFWSGIKTSIFAQEGLPPAGSTRQGRTIVNLLAFVSVPVFAFLLFENQLVGNLLYIALIPIAILLGRTMLKGGKLVRERLMAALVLTFFMTVFWAFFEQGGSSLTVFASTNVNLGLGMNAAQTNSINPFFIILFAVVFSILWTYLSKIGKNPYTPIKYALGLAQLGLAFLVFAFGANYMDEAGRVPFVFLVFGYMFISTGELFLSPVGLSKLTELSTKEIAGFMMGVWFLSAAFGHHIAGIVAKLTTGGDGDSEIFLEGIVNFVTGMSKESVANAVPAIQELFTYSTVYTQIAVISFATALFALLISPLVKKWMHGVH